MWQESNEKKKQNKTGKVNLRELIWLVAEQICKEKCEKKLDKKMENLFRGNLPNMESLCVGLQK